MQKYIVKEKTPIRLNLFLSQTGVASRRASDTLIENKKVAINGTVATLGAKVKEGDTVTIQKEEAKYEYVLYHKPRGEITGPLQKYPNLNPLGRLDKESEGILVYTNDYRLTDALLHPKNNNEKEYIVTVREQMTPRVKRILEEGIKTQEAVYKKAKVTLHENMRGLHIVLTEGKKHEIRRMLNALNLTILTLKRSRFLFLTLGNLKAGTGRPLTEQEQTKLLSYIPTQQ